jgi:hypothetical protein
MLITLGNISNGDYGEESLVSRFLLALIFNEYSAPNASGGQAFRQFGNRCLGLPFTSNDMARATATVEFQSNRCGTGGDNTTFDALLTLESDWAWGIEAKYFDTLKTEQIQREAKSISELARTAGYAHAGLLFITPEQQLGTHLAQDGEIRNCLAKVMEDEAIRVRVISWEVIFEILGETGPKSLKSELEAYCELRNHNEVYSAKLFTHPVVKDSDTWTQYFIKKVQAPANLPQLSYINDNFSKIGQASSTVSDVFKDHSTSLAEQIIKRSRLEPKAQKSGYVNLSDNGRALAQLHPHGQSIALVVREADSSCPSCSYLISVPIQNLLGYCNSNKPWLDGTKITKRPAKAFLIPAELENNSKHPAWQEVEQLLLYARSR